MVPFSSGPWRVRSGCSQDFWSRESEPLNFKFQLSLGHGLAEREIHKRFRYWDREKVPEGKEYQTAQASWPAIVPLELFQIVQSRLDWNAQRYRPKGGRNFEYLFSSTVFCGECGREMVGRSGKTKTGEKHFYYAHKVKKRETRENPGCKCRWYSFDALDLH